MSGLVTAVGGLTESVVKSSTAAVLGWGKSVKNLKMVGVLVRFSRTLLSLFEVRAFNALLRWKLLHSSFRILPSTLLSPGLLFTNVPYPLALLLTCCRSIAKTIG